MEKIIGIFDEQAAYAERLKRYINEKKDIGCYAVSFQAEQELAEFCDRKKLSYLVLGGSRAEHPERLPIPYGISVWVLSEEKPAQEEENGCGVVFRYQKAKEIVRQMLYSELSREKQMSELFTVFSPEYAGLAQVYAYKLLRNLSEKGKTLFLPWDPFCGCGRREDGSAKGASISELLYVMRKDRTQAKQLFFGLPKKCGAEYFCGPDYCTDLWQYSAEEMNQLIACCLEYGNYSHVVFLAGAFHEGVLSVMKQSSKVYLISSGLEKGEERKREFYRQMKYAGEQGVLSQLTEVLAKSEVKA